MSPHARLSTFCSAWLLLAAPAFAQTISVEALDPVVQRGTGGVTQRIRITRTGDTSKASSVSFSATGTGISPALAADFTSGFPSGTITFEGDPEPGSLWARPVLTDPVTYVNKCPEDSGGPKNVNPGKTKDVLIEFPTDRICGGSFSLSAVNDVIVIGGHLQCGSAAICPRGGGGGGAGMINVSGATGIVHIEGVHLDGNDQMIDMVRSYNSGGATLVLQNVRIERWRGEKSGDAFHGDGIHTQGGGILAAQKFQNVSMHANTYYTAGGRNGFQGPMRTTSGTGAHVTVIDRMQVTWQGSMGNAYHLGAILPNKYSDQVSDQGTTLTRVFSQNAKQVQPPFTWNTNGTGDCTEYASFPRFATGASKFTGVICNGSPAGGDFAPAARVGRNYNRSWFGQ